MSHYRRNPATDAVGTFLAVVILIAIHVALVFGLVCLPLIIVNAPTWAWLGFGLVTLYGAGSSSRN